MNHPEFQLYFMRINQGGNFNVSFSVFIPEVLTYPFKSSTLKSFDTSKIDEAVGKWIDLNDMSKEGWELVHLIHGHMIFIGLFKKELKQPQEKIEYPTDTPNSKEIKEMYDSLKYTRDLMIKEMEIPQSILQPESIELECSSSSNNIVLLESSSSSSNDNIPFIPLHLEITELHPKELESGRIIYDEVSSSSSDNSQVIEGISEEYLISKDKAEWIQNFNVENLEKIESKKTVTKIINKFSCFKICSK